MSVKTAIEIVVMTKALDDLIFKVGVGSCQLSGRAKRYESHLWKTVWRVLITETIWMRQ
jgi:hypothetical protein